MRIAITSQNFRTITGHAGKTRRFLIFEAGEDIEPGEPERLDLGRDMSLHEYHGDDHPIFSVDVVITAGCGHGFVQRLAHHGVRVIATSERDPLAALSAVVAGESLPPALPQAH
jgi:predicted Fe-Mo cluster-binding NifX family protein